MPFSGFGPQAVPFFKALAFHQTKEWFEANRAIYESEIKGPLGDLVEELAARFAKAEDAAQGRPQGVAVPHQPRRALRQGQEPVQDQRRRGADARRGRRTTPGCSTSTSPPTAAFAAAGFYQPEPEALARLRARDRARAEGVEGDGRQARRRRPRALRRICDEARAARLRGRSTIPAIAAAVRNKSFICSRDIADARLAARGLVDDSRLRQGRDCRC